MNRTTQPSRQPPPAGTARALATAGAVVGIAACAALFLEPSLADRPTWLALTIAVPACCCSR